MTGPAAGDFRVRVATAGDVHHAAAAAALIETFAGEHDIAVRSRSMLEEKIRGGCAALALAGDELIGFGYWSTWEGGKFVSHSGLVVRRDHWNRGIGRRLKQALFDASRARHPRAALISLTTSPQVKALNLALGFQVVPLDRLTTDPAFWNGCRTCRNYAQVRARGERCCCEGMLLEPAEARREP